MPSDASRRPAIGSDLHDLASGSLLQVVRRQQRNRSTAISIEVLLAAVMCVGLFGAALLLPDPRTVSSYSTSYSAWDQVRHFIAMPNCAAARLVGLAPSYPWRPGYWKAHDRDGDGVSCEPVPKSKRR